MSMNPSSLPYASLENEFLRLDYLTSLGPRIIGLYAKKANVELFAKTPDAHWPTPHGEYNLYGGHRLWTAPEDLFYMCPEDNVHIVAENNNVTLRSDVDASGLEKEISFRLDENRVELTYRVTWHGDKPIELAPWAITQLQLGGMTILPQSVTNTGLRPNRHLVLWPYSQINDDRLELHDDLILVHGRAASNAFKIGYYNPHGWIAYAMNHALFVKRFSPDDTKRYPDRVSNVEAYVKDSCVELETLGALSKPESGETLTHHETWEVNAGKYPPTLEAARTISKQLSLK